MIETFDSTSVRTTSTAQDLLNDIASRWAWQSVDYDSQHINVVEIQVSNEISISLTSDSTPKVRVYHESNEYSQPLSTVWTTYRIIRTDKALFVANGANSIGQTGAHSQFICVAKSVDLNGSERDGVVISPSASNSQVYCFTDNMSTTGKYYITTNFIKESSINTLLIPIYSINGDEHFKGVYFAFLTKASDAGKVIIDGDHYYIDQWIALPYTPS